MATIAASADAANRAIRRRVINWFVPCIGPAPSLSWPLGCGILRMLKLPKRIRDRSEPLGGRPAV